MVKSLQVTQDSAICGLLCDYLPIVFTGSEIGELLVLEFENTYSTEMSISCIPEARKHHMQRRFTCLYVGIKVNDSNRQSITRHCSARFWRSSVDHVIVEVFVTWPIGLGSHHERQICLSSRRLAGAGITTSGSWVLVQSLLISVC